MFKTKTFEDAKKLIDEKWTPVYTEIYKTSMAHKLIKIARNNHISLQDAWKDNRFWE